MKKEDILKLIDDYFEGLIFIPFPQKTKESFKKYLIDNFK